MRCCRSLCLALLLAAASLPAQQATRPDTLLGRLTTDSAAAIPDAEIIVTRGPDRTVFRTRTDTDGRWRVIADPGTGDYLVYASAPGRVAQRKRVTRSAANETRFTVDLALAPAVAATLARVEVRATKRERVDRPGDFEPGRGNAEIEQDGVYGSVPPVSSGNPAAIANAIAGLRLGPGGISALGLPGAQTITTLNGLGFAGGELPRGMSTVTRGATTAWDIERGGFSGAQVDISIRPGWIYGSNTLTVTGDLPALQATDAAGRALGQRFTRVDANFARQGAVTRDDHFTFSMAGRVRREMADVPSALDATGAAFGAAGVSADTVAHLVAALRTLGIPLGAGSGTTRTDLQFAGRVDRASYDPSTFKALPRAYGGMLLVNASSSDGVGTSALALPSASARSRDLNAALQLTHSYSGSTWLNETRTSLSVRNRRVSPSLAYPFGTVRATGSATADGGITSLMFGGNDLLSSDETAVTWETTHAAQVYATPGTRNRIKLFAQTRLDASTQRASGNALGSYSYNSLADLLSRQPASFSRTLAQADRTGATVNGALGIGSIFRTSEFFSMQYGARVEGNAFLAGPADNPAVRSSLGVRTDVSPRTLAVSPRVGFRWVYRRKRNEDSGTWYSAYGTMTTPTRGVLRGGIGEFRNFITPEAIAGPRAATGLAGSTLRLACIGAAVPLPDWASFASSASAIPSACANGAPSLADQAPGIRALDPAWRPPRSWRANLGWTTAVRNTDITIEGIASLNRAQPSSVDANFAGLARFTLPDEAGRPVFTPLSDIVSSTGGVSTVRARWDSSFGSVWVSGAAARSTSTQLSVTLQPRTTFPVLKAPRLTWVTGRVRASESGFDRSTAGDPRTFERAAGDLDVRHQFQAAGALALGKGIFLTLYLNATSGTPFTPVVSGDVNGDGVGGNDRAFVTRGAGQSSAFASAMTALLDASTPRVRACLERAMERIAQRNDCRGPWQAQLASQLVLPSRLLHLPFKSDLNLFIENPLAGIDRALHGDALRGWGATAFADPSLYTVRGFDPATRRFQYDVNPRFGRTDPRLTTLRAPFRVTLELKATLGATMPQQQLTRSLRNGRRGDTRPRRSLAEIEAQYKRNVPDLYEGVLAERDSLFITEAQAAQLNAAKARYRARADSIWKELATYLDGLGDKYDAKAALQRQEDATDAVWSLTRDDALTLDAILTPQQLPLLPWPASYLRTLKPGQKVGIRIFMN